MREDLYRRRYESNKCDQDREPFVASHVGYKDTLKTLYTLILKFQATSVCYYSRNTASRTILDMVKWDDWDALLADVKTQEEAFCAVNKIWKDTKYEEECIAHEKRHQENMESLKSIGSDVSALREIIKDAQQDTQRKGLLDWLTSIDPSENYNSARRRHKDKTGDWLIKENEDFKQWQQNPNSLLWLHGKAGSGKSVLRYVSNTITCSTRQADTFIAVLQ